MTRLTEAEKQMRDNLADILIGAGWSATSGAAFHDLGEAIPAIMRELEIKPQGDALDAMKLAITALVAVTNNAHGWSELVNEAYRGLYAAIAQSEGK